MRLLDCKDEKCQRVKAQAPPTLDYLCDECHNHLKTVLEFLDATEFPYFVNPYLVRGLDYYTKTVFEIFPGDVTLQHDQLSAIAAGGRYDGLVRLLGGKDTPAVGAAIGVERVLRLLKERGLQFGKDVQARLFLVQLGELSKKKSLVLLEEFRKAKIPLQESLGRDSIKSQLRLADKVGAEYTLILGQKEALDETIIIREMDSGSQETIPIDKIIPHVKKRLAKKKKSKKSKIA